MRAVQPKFKFSNKLYGKVADLGAGWGYLSAKALESNMNIKEISLVESNLNALNCSRKNILNFKAKFFWADIEIEDLKLENYDHVIMNPPFHKGKKFVHSLVTIFLNTAKNLKTIPFPQKNHLRLAKQILSYHHHLEEALLLPQPIQYKILRHKFLHHNA